MGSSLVPNAAAAYLANQGAHKCHTLHQQVIIVRQGAVLASFQMVRESCKGDHGGDDTHHVWVVGISEEPCNTQQES